MILKPYQNLILEGLDFNFVKDCPKRQAKDQDFRVKYKTELCRNWELGLCEFGETCAFAHGVHELRDKVSIGLKYKTKNCKQFHELGYCIYGNRCQFKHRDTAESTPNLSPKSNDSCGNEESGKKRLRVFVEITKE